ncbi:MAG: iron ABC transporter permease [Thermoplasmatales archaeon]|nr:iron ABC transporter permease [Thermoplasmatales archaeon]
MRFGKGIEKPFAHISERISYYLKSDEPGHNVRSKRRLFTVLIAGIVLTLALFLTCLCVGPTATFSLPEMLSSLKSAVSKGGKMLSYNELMVYESRLPRTMAALAVGIGLSIAGSVYQAIIRNPLVDPYIMGVSAGAGTAAVAVIAFNFTFFGLFAPHSIYVTAFAAIVGGIAAFAATMFIAEKAGGSSLNYVLAGVIIGLAFSAIQTLMLSFAGHRVSNALSWLFGSFANVTWNQVWLIVAPALTLAIAPLLWAKELNLVLLGEDQAQQMGLDVRNFNRWMLILASVLTSICVAFVGIIGFVGLVVPHLCRMMLGGDHRLVLPASIVFGGALMMAADLVARMAYAGLELPVGAITTIIGVPVFAYLLIKRGNLYEG